MVKRLYAMNKYKVKLKVEGRRVTIFLWGPNPDTILGMVLGEDGVRAENIKVLSVRQVESKDE